MSLSLWRGGVAHAIDWQEVLPANGDTDASWSVGQAIGYVTRSDRSHHQQDVTVANANAGHRLFEWIGAGVPPTQAHIKMHSTFTSPSSIVVDNTTNGPSGASAYFFVNHSVVKSYNASYNYYQNRIDYTSSPPESIFTATAQATMSDEMQMDYTYKHYAGATFALRATNTASVNSEYGTSNTGMPYFYFVATAKSGQSTIQPSSYEVSP